MTQVATETYPPATMPAESAPTDQLVFSLADQIAMFAYPEAEAAPHSSDPTAVADRVDAIAADYQRAWGLGADRGVAAVPETGAVYSTQEDGRAEVIVDNNDYTSVIDSILQRWDTPHPDAGWDAGTRRVVATWQVAERAQQQASLAQATASLALVESLAAGLPEGDAENLAALYGQPPVHEPVVYPAELSPANPYAPTSDEVLDAWAREAELLRVAPAGPTPTIHAKQAVKTSGNFIAAEQNYVGYESPVPVDPDSLSPQAYSDLYRRLRQDRMDELQAERRNWFDRWDNRPNDKREANVHATWVLTGHRNSNELPDLGGVTHLLPPSDSWRAKFYHFVIGTNRGSNKPAPIKQTKVAAVRAKLAIQVSRIPVSPALKAAIPELIGSASQATGAATRWVKGYTSTAFWTAYKHTVGKLPFRVQQGLPWAVGATGVVAIAALTPLLASQTMPAQIPLDKIVDGVIQAKGRR